MVYSSHSGFDVCRLQFAVDFTGSIICFSQFSQTVNRKLQTANRNQALIHPSFSQIPIFAAQKNHQINYTWGRG